MPKYSYFDNYYLLKYYDNNNSWYIMVLFNASISNVVILYKYSLQIKLLAIWVKSRTKNLQNKT